MIVTINTDASYHHPSKIGSYAYWIKSDYGVINKYGCFKEVVENNQVAELMAIVNALHALSKSNWECIRRIVINTDCMNVIHYLNGDKSAIKRYDIKVKYFKSIGALYFKYKKEYFPDAHIFLRHVKAHVDITDSRKYVNDWCDKYAKKALGQRLNSV